MQNVLIASVAYAFFQFLAGIAASKLSDLWFLLLGTVSIVIFTAVIASFQLLGGNSLGKITLAGFMLILVANGFITLFTFFLGRSFQAFPATFVIPLVFGGAILLSTLASYVLHRQMPTLLEVGSLLMISGGLVLLGLQSSKS